MAEQEKKINCIRCEYFVVTWDPAKPRGCRVFGFKGMEMPSVTVLKTTGKPCPSFKLKIRNPDLTP